MEVSLELQHADWLRDITAIYKDGFEVGFGEMVSAIRDLVRGRTPKDLVTKSGRAKSFGEHIQESWQIEPDGWSATIFTDFDYGPILEEGLYPFGRPTKRTDFGPDGGLYSRQAIGGIVGPLLNEPDTISGAIDLVVEELTKRFDQELTRK